jgi:hypothetical protein
MFHAHAAIATSAKRNSCNNGHHENNLIPVRKMRPLEQFETPQGLEALNYRA